MRVKTIIYCGLVLLLFSGFDYKHSKAQFDNWSISEKVISERLAPPTMVADSEGNLHVFWSYFVHPTTQGQIDPIDATLVNYIHYDGKNWSPSLDILSIPDASGLMGIEAAIDLKGYLHIIWQAQGNPQGVYYSNSHIDKAEDLKSWIQPKKLGSSNSYGESQHLAVSSDNTLHVLLIDNSSGEFNVVHISSNNYGNSWSRSARLSSVDPSARAKQPRIAIDSNNVLHAVWVEEFLNQDSPRRSIAYSQSLDQGETWTTPQFLVSNKNVGYPNIQCWRDIGIYIAWDGSQPDSGRYLTISRDYGVTWSTPELFWDSAGQSGWPQLEFDSFGTLHILSDTSVLNGIYAQWKNGIWINKQPLPPELTGEYIRAVITHGNRLNVLTWAGDYSFQIVAAEALPTQIYPTQAPTSVPVAVTNPPEEKMVTKDPTAQFAQTEPYIEGNSRITFPLFAGFLAAMIIILVVLLASVIKISRK